MGKVRCAWEFYGNHHFPISLIAWLIADRGNESFPKYARSYREVINDWVRIAYLRY